MESAKLIASKALEIIHRINNPFVLSFPKVMYIGTTDLSEEEWLLENINLKRTLHFFHEDVPQEVSQKVIDALLKLRYKKINPTKSLYSGKNIIAYCIDHYE